MWRNVLLLLYGWSFVVEGRHENETLVKFLHGRRPQIFCYIETGDQNLFSRALIPLYTWGKFCDKTIIFSESNVAFLGDAVIGTRTEPGYYRLLDKTNVALNIVYERFLNDYDWFLKADDDTFVFIENLHRIVQDVDPEEPLWTGCKFRVGETDYHSGGAGYMFSRGGLRNIGPFLKRRSSHMPEDLEVGRIAKVAGVNFLESRDRIGRLRFIPLNINDFLFHRLPDWLLTYATKPYPDGKTSLQLTDTLICAHYMNNNEMLLAYYLVYKVRKNFNKPSALRAEYMACGVSSTDCNDKSADYSSLGNYIERMRKVPSRPLSDGLSVHRGPEVADALRVDGSLEDVITLHRDRKFGGAAVNLTCAIMSSEATFDNYGVMAANTWAKYCDDYLIFTDTKTLRAEQKPTADEDWESRIRLYSSTNETQRLLEVISVLADLDKAGWFLIVGDTSYMLVDHLKSLLKKDMHVCLGVEDRYAASNLREQYPVVVPMSVLKDINKLRLDKAGGAKSMGGLCTAAAIATIPASVVFDKDDKLMFNIFAPGEDFFKPLLGDHWIDRVHVALDLEGSLPSSSPVSLYVYQHAYTSFTYHYLLYTLNLYQPMK